MIPAIVIIAICWGIWAVKTFLDCKKSNMPVKFKIKELWNNRFWIGPEKLINIREILALAIIAVRFGYEILSNYYDAPFEFKGYVCISLLMIYTFVIGNFTLKQYIVFGILEVLLFFDPAGYNVAMFCILAVYDVGTAKFAKLFFSVLSVLYGISFILSVSGIISAGNMSAESTRGTSDGWISVRHSFGFCHPNTAGLLLVALVILFFAVRFSKLKWWDWLTGFAALGIVTFVIDSRGAAVFLLVFLLLMFIAKYCPKFYGFKLIKYACPVVPLLCASISVYATYFYDSGNALWSKINSLSTGRIFLMFSAAKQIPITLFGQVTNPSISSEYYIDNFYVNFLMYQGIIPFLTLISCYVFLLYRLCKFKAYPEVAVVISYMIYYCFENRFFATFTNYTFVLFLFAFSVGSKLFILSTAEKDKNLILKTETEKIRKKEHV